MAKAQRHGEIACPASQYLAASDNSPNKFPRPAGQGASRQVYGLLGISGSQTGGQGVVDISIPELVQSGQTGITSTWPLNIPASGKQTEYKLNVPYRFFGLSESLSWLAAI